MNDRKYLEKMRYKIYTYIETIESKPKIGS
jgi:hypothetical protein